MVGQIVGSRRAADAGHDLLVETDELQVLVGLGPEFYREERGVAEAMLEQRAAVGDDAGTQQTQHLCKASCAHCCWLGGA